MKQLRLISTTLLIGLFSVNAAMAQELKIGYTNIELILAYMPEMETVQKDLQVYQQKLSKKIKVKEDYAQVKLNEYYEMAQAGKLTASQEEEKIAELEKLDKEIQQMSSNAEMELMQMRQELLQPAIDRLQKAIEEVSEEQGYTYVLNHTTSGGVSTILHAPEAHDVTEAIMKKLGIELPSEEELEGLQEDIKLEETAPGTGTGTTPGGGAIEGGE